MFDFGRLDWLSFDCYGTLVDWESGIAAAIGRVLSAHAVSVPREQVLDLFAEIEPKIQASGDYLAYRQVLRRVMEAIGTRLGTPFEGPDLDCLAASLAGWPIFPEVNDALETLGSRYKLAVISNVDDDLFAATANRFNCRFDAVVTAEMVGSYKPSLRNFRVAANRMGVENEDWLHVAESLFHDIAPANRLGIRSAWVNRAGRGGGTRQADAAPDLEIGDLSELTRLAGLP